MCETDIEQASQMNTGRSPTLTKRTLPWTQGIIEETEQEEGSGAATIQTYEKEK